MSFLDNIELEEDKENLNAAKSKAKLGRKNASTKSGKDEILEAIENLKAKRQRRMAVRNPNLDENSKQKDIDENSQRSKSKRNNKNRQSEAKPEKTKNVEDKSENVIKKCRSVVRNVDRCKSQCCTFCKSKFENFKTFSKHIANEHAEKLQERKQLKVICSG